MEGLEFRSQFLGFICEGTVLPLFSLLSQLRPVLISSSCYSSRISNQKSSGKDTGEGVCAVLSECPGKYLLLTWIIWTGISKLSPASILLCQALEAHSVLKVRKSGISSWFWRNFLQKPPQFILSFFSSNLSSLCFWPFGITSLLRFVIPVDPFQKKLELQNNYGSRRKKLCKALCLRFFSFSDLQDLKEKVKIQDQEQGANVTFSLRQTINSKGYC